MNWKRIKQNEGRMWRCKGYTIMDEWGDGSEWTLYWGENHAHFDTLKEAKDHAESHHKTLTNNLLTQIK